MHIFIYINLIEKTLRLLEMLAKVFHHAYIDYYYQIRIKINEQQNLKFEHKF